MFFRFVAFQMFLNIEFFVMNYALRTITNITKHFSTWFFIFNWRIFFLHIDRKFPVTFWQFLCWILNLEVHKPKYIITCIWKKLIIRSNRGNTKKTTTNARLLHIKSTLKKHNDWLTRPSSLTFCHCVYRVLHRKRILENKNLLYLEFASK